MDELQTEAWIEPVRQSLERHPHSAVFVLMESYRPDMALNMASQLNLRFVDYREDYMSAYGVDAGSISLRELNSALKNISQQHAAVVFNVEALLATYTVEERKQWFNDLVTSTFDHSIIIPLAIYQNEAPSESQVCDIQSIPLPEQGLISRLLM